MNLETKITIYKFTPQLFTLTPNSYCLYAQRNCKKWHFWKKTWTLGWAIDISNKNIIEHKGIPIFIGPILDTKKFQNDLFGK